MVTNNDHDECNRYNKLKAIVINYITGNVTAVIRISIISS